MPAKRIVINLGAGTRTEQDDITKCRNRGGAIDTRQSELCGCRNKTETVYACPEYGSCTPRKYKLNQPEAVCLTCDKREP